MTAYISLFGFDSRWYFTNRTLIDASIHPSVLKKKFFLCLLMDRTDKKRHKAERGGMTRSKRPSDAGFEPGPTAARTGASIRSHE